jgi:hypothetical protein
MTSTIPDFENYPISTQTLIIKTNLTIDCQKFYDSIDCKVITKPETGKKRMSVCVEDGQPEGSIVFAQYKNTFKGTPFKKISKKHFLNSVTIIMNVGVKYVNIKVSNKGKLQITGCNKTIHPVCIIQHFWSTIVKESSWEFQPGETCFKASVIPVMSNINFSIDFQINRESLNNIINTKTEHISILETSDGYVGVNIKIHKKKESLDDVLVDQYSYINDRWELSKTKVMDYIQTLSTKEQKKKISKCYINTFLVFYSGKVIMSGGISTINRKSAYEEFMSILRTYKNEIMIPERKP